MRGLTVRDDTRVVEGPEAVVVRGLARMHSSVPDEGERQLVLPPMIFRSDSKVIRQAIQ